MLLLQIEWLYASKAWKLSGAGPEPQRQVQGWVTRLPLGKALEIFAELGACHERRFGSGGYFVEHYLLAAMPIEDLTPEQIDMGRLHLLEEVYEEARRAEHLEAAARRRARGQS